MSICDLLWEKGPSRIKVQFPVTVKEVILGLSEISSVWFYFDMLVHICGMLLNYSYEAEIILGCIFQLSGNGNNKPKYIKVIITCGRYFLFKLSPCSTQKGLSINKIPNGLLSWSKSHFFFPLGHY